MFGLREGQAPALMSRKAFEALGAVPDVFAGTMYFRALQCTTQLSLSPCIWQSDLTSGAKSRLLGHLNMLLNICHQCPGPAVHVHSHVLVGNSERSQVYTTALAKAVIRGLHASLKAAGDERLNRPEDIGNQLWLADTDQEELQFPNRESPGETLTVTNYFLDVSCHEDSWLPLLKEAEVQLRDKVRPDKVIPTNTPFGEQLKALVPWKVLRIQICRTPMQRRLPLEVLQAGAQHRGSALWLSDGSVVIEAEAVSRVLAQSAGRFTTPVRVAVFFFSIAPATI